jgi:hypothetical protein
MFRKPKPKHRDESFRLKLEDEEEQGGSLESSATVSLRTALSFDHSEGF